MLSNVMATQEPSPIAAGMERLAALADVRLDVAQRTGNQFMVGRQEFTGKM